MVVGAHFISHLALNSSFLALSNGPSVPSSKITLLAVAPPLPYLSSHHLAPSSHLPTLILSQQQLHSFSCFALRSAPSEYLLVARSFHIDCVFIHKKVRSAGLHAFRPPMSHTRDVKQCQQCAYLRYSRSYTNQCCIFSQTLKLSKNFLDSNHIETLIHDHTTPFATTFLSI